MENQYYSMHQGDRLVGVMSLTVPSTPSPIPQFKSSEYKVTPLSIDEYRNLERTLAITSTKHAELTERK
jgi:hypothetical protein